MAERSGSQEKTNRQNKGVEPKRSTRVPFVDEPPEHHSTHCASETRQRQRSPETVVATAERMKHHDAPGNRKAHLHPPIGEIEHGAAPRRRVGAVRYRAHNGWLRDAKDRQD